jgi:hypothetical protein
VGCCVRSPGGGVCICGVSSGRFRSLRLFGCAEGGRSFRAGVSVGRIDSGRTGVVALGGMFGAGWLSGRSMLGVFGVADLPGGAILTLGCEAGEFAGRNVCTLFRSRGCPGCVAKACCCLAKGTGAGGGVALAITCRFATAGGGAAIRRPVLLALDPSTLSREGATVALELTGAEAISRMFTATATFATGCALTKVRCGTAVIAPATFLFR